MTSSETDVKKYQPSLVDAECDISRVQATVVGRTRLTAPTGDGRRAAVKRKQKLEMSDRAWSVARAA